MKVCFYSVLCLFAIAGCQSEPPAPVEGKDSTSKSSAASGSQGEATAVAIAKIRPGMDMSEVKKLKGTPKDTKHEHGAQGAEIDLWIYDDETVKFQDGKVVE